MQNTTLNIHQLLDSIAPTSLVSRVFGLSLSLLHLILLIGILIISLIILIG